MSDDRERPSNPAPVGENAPTRILKRRGPPKGSRPSGRRPGSRNKATIERERQAGLDKERAELEAQAQANGDALTKARVSGIKLAKDVLDDFMKLFAGMAAFCQPWPAAAGKNPHEDITKFNQYAALAVDAAKALAPFQSPRFSAMVIGATVVTKVKVEGGMPDDFAAPALPAPNTIDGKATEIAPGTIINADDDFGTAAAA